MKRGVFFVVFIVGGLGLAIAVLVLLVPNQAQRPLPSLSEQTLTATIPDATTEREVPVADGAQVPSQRSAKQDELKKKGEDLLKALKDDPSNPARDEWIDWLFIHHLSLSSTDAAYILRQRLDQESRNGRYPLHLVSACAYAMFDAGQYEDAVVFLKTAITTIEEDKYDLVGYRGHEIKNKEMAKAVVKEFEKQIKEFESDLSMFPRADRNESLQGVQAEQEMAQDAAPEEEDPSSDALERSNLGDAKRPREERGDRDGVATVLRHEAARKPLQERLPALDKVHSEYGDTEAGELALFDKALILEREGSPEQYLEAMNEYLAAYPKGVRAADAASAIGNSFLMKNDAPGALKYFELVRDLCHEKEVVSAEIIGQLEILYEKAGNMDALKGLLQGTLDDIEAGHKLTSIQGKPPSEFDNEAFKQDLRDMLEQVNAEGS